MIHEIQLRVRRQIGRTRLSASRRPFDRRRWPPAPLVQQKSRKSPPSKPLKIFLTEPRLPFGCLADGKLKVALELMLFNVEVDSLLLN